MADSASFDPYYKWLGIPPAEQPPNHYRLLGVQLFESDADVLASAADRQMAHVKSFAGGPYAAQSQKLLDELAKARICLLTPVAKDAYDDGLQQATSQSGIMVVGEAENGHGESSAAGVDAWPPGVSGGKPSRKKSGRNTNQQSSRSKKRNHARQKRHWGWTVGYLAFSLAGLITCFFLADRLGVFGSSSERGPVVQNHPKPDDRQPTNSDNTPPLETPTETVQRPTDAFVPAYDNLPVLEPQIIPELQPHPEPLPETDVVVPPEPATPDETGEPAVPDTTTSAPSPFDAMPNDIELPTLGKEQIEIGTVGFAEGDTLLLQVLSMDKDLRTMPRFFSRQVEPTDGPPQWNVYYATAAKREALKTDEAAVEPIAKFLLKDKRLFMQWTPDTKSVASWKSLQNCLVELALGESRHLFQLRKAIVDQPVRFTDRSKPVEVRADLTDLPPTANMYLEVTRLAGFPQLALHDGNPDKLPEKQQAIWNCTDADYAGTTIKWERSRNRISFRTASWYKLESTGQKLYVLSEKDLTTRDRELQIAYKTGRQEERRRLSDRDHRRLENELTRAINQRFGAMPLSEYKHRRQAAMAAVQAKIQHNDARIAFLAENLPIVNNDLQSRIPRLKKLSVQFAEIDKGGASAEIRFRLYSLADGRKVILYTNDPLLDREWDTKQRIVAPPPLPSDESNNNKPDEESGDESST